MLLLLSSPPQELLALPRPLGLLEHVAVLVVDSLFPTLKGVSAAKLILQLLEFQKQELR